MSDEVEASCHCGAIRIVLAQAPAQVTDCNCSICRRYGVLWAYYSPRQVRFVPEVPMTDAYSWGERSLAFHRCRVCGCVTHWQAFDASVERMGINARLMDLDVIARATVRILDGAVTERYVE